MATTRYVGRTPDSDSTIVPKSYADAQQAALAVTSTVVGNLIVSNSVNLTSQSYVDTQDGLRAHKAAVTAADNLYVPTTALNAVNGVAGLDSSGSMLNAQIPSSGVVLDRVPKCYSLGQTGTLPSLGGTPSAITGAIGTQNLAAGAAHTVTTTTLREFQLASIVVPDPGYPWRPLPFAWVQGNSSPGTTPGSRQVGNSNWGLLLCMPPSGVSNTIYGLGLCTDSIATDTYNLTPHAIASQTQISIPPITGGLELDLYGCLFQGTFYQFLGNNLQYFILVMPSL